MGGREDALAWHADAAGQRGARTDDGPPARFAHQPALDGARAVAVLSVIAFHFGLQQVQGGFLGVDLFFVLSGYLITSLLLVEWGSSGTIDFVAFWGRRARRLLPALVVVVMAIAVWAALAAPSDRLAAIRTDGLWTMFYGANWHLVISGQSYFDLFSEASPFRHAWSLAIEEQFYLVWPLVAFATLWVARGRAWLLGVVCASGLVASAAAMHVLYDPGDPSRAYYGTDTRAHGLLIGALLAVVLARHQTRREHVSLRWAGGVAAAAIIVLFVAGTDAAGWLYPGGFLGFEVAVAVVIAAVTQPGRSVLGAALSWRPLRWVGAISYGLYLWHWPITIALSESRTGWTGWQLGAARLAATFGLAIASYYAVEQPIRLRRLPRGRVAWIAAPVGVAVGVSVLLLGTTGATPPPEYLAAPPGKARDTVAAVVRDPAYLPENLALVSQAVVPSPVPNPVLLLGDSVADNLAQPLSDEAARHGVALNASVHSGCGVLGGVTHDQEGMRIRWGQECSDEIPRDQARSVTRYQPQLVVLLSTWEGADREVDGTTVLIDAPEGEAVWRRLLDETRARVTAGGARLALVLMPGLAQESDLGTADPEPSRRIAIMNGIYERYARDHADSVVVVDLAKIVCPGGSPCPTVVDGVRLRPIDGGHFDASGAAWVAPRLYDAIVRAAILPPGV